MSSFRPWKEGEQNNYQNLLNSFYQHFTEVVTQNRPSMDAEQLIDSYGAKVFPVGEAQEFGFIDVGNAELSDVIAELALAAGIEKDKKYQVIAYETKSWWKRTFKSESPFVTGRMKHELAIPGLGGDSNFLQYLYTH